LSSSTNSIKKEKGISNISLISFPPSFIISSMIFFIFFLCSAHVSGFKSFWPTAFFFLRPFALERQIQFVVVILLLRLVHVIYLISHLLRIGDYKCLQPYRAFDQCFLVLTFQRLKHRPLSLLRHRFYGRRFRRDRKSTRLNSSHVSISYAVFCLKKKIEYK